MLTVEYELNSALSDAYAEASFCKLRSVEVGIGRERSTHASAVYPSAKDLHEPFVNISDPSRPTFGLKHWHN